MRYKLNEVEEKTLDKWISSRKVKSALYKGAKLSITFTETGIGLHKMAELDKGLHADDMVVYPPLSKDITDYGCW